MLHVHRQIELRQPVLLCAFSGWSDAATAASGTLTYLLQRWDGHELASYDAEQVYNYTVTRPLVRLEDGGQRELQWPSLTWTALPLPNADHDLLVLLGPEPDLRWQACARATVDLARQLGVERIVGLGCFYAPVAHTAPVKLTGTSTDRALRGTLERLGLRDTGYEGPTGFMSALLDTARRRGLTTATVWGAAPRYLPDMPNPKVSAALLNVVERLLRLDLGQDELAATGRELVRRIDEALRERPDLRAFVTQLLADEGGDAAELQEEPPEELPSAAAVLEDLEQFLQRLQRPGEER